MVDNVFHGSYVPKSKCPSWSDCSELKIPIRQQWSRAKSIHCSFAVQYLCLRNYLFDQVCSVCICHYGNCLSDIGLLCNSSFWTALLPAKHWHKQTMLTGKVRIYVNACALFFMDNSVLRVGCFWQMEQSSYNHGGMHQMKCRTWLQIYPYDLNIWFESRFDFTLQLTMATRGTNQKQAFTLEMVKVGLTNVTENKKHLMEAFWYTLVDAPSETLATTGILRLR